MQLKNYLIIHNSAVEYSQFEIWTRTEYEKYISDTLGVGACPAVRIITDFNESDSLLRGTASLEQEAERLYPHPQETYVSPDGVTKMYSNDNKCKAEGYITAARQYMGEIDKLRAENEKMRKALEWADEEINALYQKDGTWGSEILGEIRQALKTTTHG